MQNVNRKLGLVIAPLAMMALIQSASAAPKVMSGECVGSECKGLRNSQALDHANENAQFLKCKPNENAQSTTINGQPGLVCSSDPTGGYGETAERETRDALANMQLSLAHVEKNIADFIAGGKMETTSESFDNVWGTFLKGYDQTLTTSERKEYAVEAFKQGVKLARHKELQSPITGLIFGNPEQATQLSRVAALVRKVVNVVEGGNSEIEYATAASISDLSVGLTQAQMDGAAKKVRNDARAISNLILSTIAGNETTVPQTIKNGISSARAWLTDDSITNRAAITEAAAEQVASMALGRVIPNVTYVDSLTSEEKALLDSTYRYLANGRFVYIQQNAGTSAL